MFHRTETGLTQLVCEWGNGKGSEPKTNRPATIVTNDGDGHYQQWSFTGRIEDALVTLARLEKPIRKGGHVAIREGAGYCVESEPDDFWIEENDKFYPNLAAYQNAIAW